MKKLTALVLTFAMVLGLAACGGGNGAPTSTPGPGNSTGGDKTYSLKVAGIDGSITLFPVYVAQEKGWFDEASLDIERGGHRYLGYQRDGRWRRPVRPDLL